MTRLAFALCLVAAVASAATTKPTTAKAKPLTLREFVQKCPTEKEGMTTVQRERVRRDRDAFLSSVSVKVTGKVVDVERTEESVCVAIRLDRMRDKCYATMTGISRDSAINLNVDAEVTVVGTPTKYQPTPIVLILAGAEFAK